MEERKLSKDVEQRVQEILEFVNQLPLKDKDAKFKMAQKLIDEAITDDPDEAYVSDKDYIQLSQDLSSDKSILS